MKIKKVLQGINHSRAVDDGSLTIIAGLMAIVIVIFTLYFSVLALAKIII